LNFGLIRRGGVARLIELVMVLLVRLSMMSMMMTTMMTRKKTLEEEAFRWGSSIVLLVSQLGRFPCTLSLQSRLSRGWCEDGNQRINKSYNIINLV